MATIYKTEDCPLALAAKRFFAYAAWIGTVQRNVTLERECKAFKSWGKKNLLGELAIISDEKASDG